VPIFDVGESRGLHYLIMQYVEGQDLGARLEQGGKLPPAEAGRIVSQVARALVGAHAKGVVHRDLKPANIRLNQEGNVVVLDFGIAKARETATSLTSIGEQLGTPAYMPPEQIRGESCDGRSDLYALGVVFFELLTGRRPFIGETRHAVEYAQLYTAPPSPDQFNPPVPPGYCQVVLRLLEKDPTNRYQSAQELLDHLEALEQAAAHAAAAPRRLPAPSRSKARWRITAGLLAVVAAALAVYLTREPAAVAPPMPALRAAPAGMSLVPAGSFTFGDASAESPNPLRTASLPAFYMDATEVSNVDYKRFCDATGRPYPETPPWDPNYFTAQSGYPVVNVTLVDAQAYAAWAGKRLPTEEEWEKAARGSDGRRYPWGDTPPMAAQANLGGAADGFEQAAPVEAFAAWASPYGIRNLAGNVWEWTTSRYPATTKERTEMKTLLPEAAGDWYVIKGGSFAPQTEELWLRAYMRRGMPAAGKSPYIGFRCVKNAN
jgi:serine/threonine-protein kinase